MPIVGRAQRRTMPWRNGGGTSHELWREGGEEPELRIALAEIGQDGPFSVYPGVDRALVLLEGDGIVLRRADGLEIAHARPLVPFSLHGEDGWTCLLRGGPVLDLNVMVSRARRRASMVVLEVGETPLLLQKNADLACFAFVARGRVAFESTVLDTHELLVTDEDVELSSAEGAVIVLVRVDAA